jgi:hypothetical protein
MSKVPRDPNMSLEVRRFLDDQSRESDGLSERVDALEDDALVLATQAEAEAGTDNEAYMSPLRVAQAIAAIGLSVLHVQDQKAANTDGGTFTSGADRTRTLNTAVTNTITGASLASNQVTLPAGTYIVVASVPGFEVESHRAWLYNITAAATTLLGSSEFSAHTSSNSNIYGVFTVAGATVFEIRHRCSVTKATDGFGAAANFNSANEVYTNALFVKI